MVETDLSKVKKKKPKISISLSLDKENMEFLKKDIEEYGDGVTPSGVFDFWLKKFVESSKEKRKREGEEKSEK